MSQIYPKLQEIKESVQSDSRHQVSLLVQPTLQALNATFAHYDLDLQKRSVVATNKPPNVSDNSSNVASTKRQLQRCCINDKATGDVELMKRPISRCCFNENNKTH